MKLETVAIAVRGLEAAIAFTDLGVTVLGRDVVAGERMEAGVRLDGNRTKMAVLQTEGVGHAGEEGHHAGDQRGLVVAPCGQGAQHRPVQAGDPVTVECVLQHRGDGNREPRGEGAAECLPGRQPTGPGTPAAGRTCVAVPAAEVVPQSVPGVRAMRPGGGRWTGRAGRGRRAARSSRRPAGSRGRTAARPRTACRGARGDAKVRARPRSARQGPSGASPPCRCGGSPDLRREDIGMGLAFVHRSALAVPQPAGWDSSTPPNPALRHWFVARRGDAGRGLRGRAPGRLLAGRARGGHPGRRARAAVRPVTPPPL